MRYIHVSESAAAAAGLFSFLSPRKESELAIKHKINGSLLLYYELGLAHVLYKTF